jgi:electron transport complex protein RnfC
MARAKTFTGGIHPAYNKDRTASLAITRAQVPKVLVFPLSQHIGAPCQPLVSVGERVLRGQKIADSEARISAPIHSSVSGKVIAIELRPHPSGKDVMAIVVENDSLDELAAPIAGSKRIEQLSSAEIVNIVREAGIVGLGGAAFPTHFKLVPPPQAKIDMVILNGAECEPYLTCDHRIMVERPDDVVQGLRLLMKAVGVNKGYIGVEVNKPDAIDALNKACAAYTDVQVVPLQVKYPQGLELQLIKAVSGRELPSGKLPADVGVIVNNVGTAAAVAEAVLNGCPLIERVVTVTGSMVDKPQNLLVRLGTSFGDLLAECGLNGQPGKVIQGGPMMGMTQGNMSVPVTKGVSGILALSEAESAPLEAGPCIRCARCVDACPMLLQPIFLAQFAERGLLEQAEAYHILDCRECGCCSWVCPARRPLLQNIRLAKSAILAKKRR